MASKDSILGIDIGADSLKIAEFSFQSDTGKMVLEDFTFLEYGGDLKEEELGSALKNILVSALSGEKFKTKKVHLSISGQQAFLRFVKLPPIGDKEERVRQVVEYEAKQNVPYPIEQVVWDYQLIGSAEGESEIEVMFVVIKDTVIEEITDIIESLGKEVLLVDVAPASCYNSARANDVGGEDCVMILNIGSKCSSLVFIDKGRFFVRTIPIAGHAITQQISKEFGIPFTDAEELKRKHGFVALGGAYEEPDSEVAATISKIIRNVMTRLHGEINRSINVYRSQQKGNKPSRMLLAGGSSVMAFTPRFFTEKLKIPAEYFNPFQVVSLSQNINREQLAEVAHMFSEVIGLGLRRATVCPIEISLVPQKLKRQQEIKHKAPYLLISAASLVACLTLLLLAFVKQEQVDKKISEISQNEVKRTEELKNQVKTSKARLDAIVYEYNNAQKILQERTKWTDLVEALQELLPENMWLVSIEAKETAEGVVTSAEEPTEDAGPKAAFPIFDRRRRRSGGTAAAASTNLEWLELKGYFLYFTKNNTPLEATLKENLIKSDFFTKDIKEIQTIEYKPEINGNNITMFKLAVKLKTPIPAIK